MKNIHVLPTDKDSKLYLGNLGKPVTIQSASAQFKKPLNIYITSDEKIKEGDVFLHPDNTIERASRDLDGRGLKKIILTDNKDLIKNGVQAIDDAFLEWFVKNPSCEFVEVKHFGTCCGNQLIAECINCKNYNPVYKIIIPKEEPKQDLRKYPLTPDECFKQTTMRETIEEVAERLFPIFQRSTPFGSKYPWTPHKEREAFKRGAKWKADRMFSEEDMREAIRFGFDKGFYSDSSNMVKNLRLSEYEWFSQFNKELNGK
jgi:hypothetical protein